MADSLRHAVGGAGDRHAAEAVADEDDVLDLLRLQVLDQILHEGLQRDGPGEQVAALAEAGLRRRGDPMAPSAQQTGDVAPAPITVDENEGIACYYMCISGSNGLSRLSWKIA